jgi:hypothetical protein
LSIAKLGVDFGRVINGGSSHLSGDDTSFLSGSEEDMLATPETAGASESLARLVVLFDGGVWIVSKAGQRTQANTERWLAHRDFYAATGIPPDHVRFVRRRVDKAEVCAELGITHFVDDRAEVLQYLVGLVPNLYLFGPQEHPIPSHMVATPTWESAERAIRVSLIDA